MSLRVLVAVIVGIVVASRICLCSPILVVVEHTGGTGTLLIDPLEGTESRLDVEVQEKAFALLGHWVDRSIGVMQALPGPRNRSLSFQVDYHGKWEAWGGVRGVPRRARLVNLFALPPPSSDKPSRLLLVLEKQGRYWWYIVAPGPNKITRLSRNGVPFGQYNTLQNTPGVLGCQLYMILPSLR